MSVQANFTEQYFVSSFSSGLKDKIKGAVKMFNPSKMSDVVYLAKQEEFKLYGDPPQYNPPYQKNSNTST